MTTGMFCSTQMYQNMDSQGVFYQTPKSSDGVPLAPLEATLFNTAYDKDRFESTAWTVNGKFGDMKAVYTGGYLVRHVDQIGDYTNYSRGTYADYYQCYGPGSGGDLTLTSTCFSPSASWRTAERNEHMQHEIRLSTPDEWRLRGIVGAYYEDNKLFDRTGLDVQDHSGIAPRMARRARRAIPAASRTSARFPAPASKVPVFRTTTPPSIKTRGAEPSRRLSSCRWTST